MIYWLQEELTPGDDWVGRGRALATRLLAYVEAKPVTGLVTLPLPSPVQVPDAFRVGLARVIHHYVVDWGSAEFPGRELVRADIEGDAPRCLSTSLECIV